MRCSPEGIRTLATAVRGRRPRPLDDGAGRRTILPRPADARRRPRAPGREGRGLSCAVAPKGFEPSLPP